MLLLYIIYSRSTQTEAHSSIQSRQEVEYECDQKKKEKKEDKKWIKNKNLPLCPC